MIEINLLPEDMRRPEGTPIPRLLSIILSLIAVLCGLFMVAKYMFLDIPDAKETLKAQQQEQAHWAAEAEKVNVLIAQRDKLKGQLKVFQALEKGRVLYARVLYRIMRARPGKGEFPDGNISLKSLRVEEDTGTAPTPGGGKAFKITIKGWATGPDYEKMAKIYRKFLDNLELELKAKVIQEEKKEDQVVAQVSPAPSESEGDGLPAGFDKFLRVKFENPSPEREVYGDMTWPRLPPVYDKPNQGMDFSFIVKFSLPATDPQ